MGKYEDLNRLQTLRSNGSITEEEFEREKEKVLNDNTTRNTEGVYVASLILGICTILVALVPILNIILSIIAIVVCIVANKKLKANNEKKGMVTAGLVCTIIGLVIAVIVSGATFGTLINNSKKEVISGVSSTNNNDNITNMAVTCAQDTKDNRIIKLFSKNEEIQNIKYITDNGTTIILIQTTQKTIYAYKNTTFYGTDGTADVSTSGRTSEELEMIKKGKEIRQWWSKGTELNTDKILNKLK